MFDYGVWLIQALDQKGIVIGVPDLAALDQKGTVRVLLVDDDSSIFEVSKQILVDMDDRFDFEHARCVDEAFKKISTGKYNLIISDYEMPQKNGLQFLEELRKQNNGIPFILFTGKGREEIAIKALNLGADGYVNKQGNPETVYGELFHLTNQILMRKQAELKQIESEAKFRQVFATAPDALYICTLNEGRFIEVNDGLSEMFGYTKQEIIGKTPLELGLWAEPSEREKLVTKLRSEGKIRSFELFGKRKNGEVFPAQLSISLIQIGNQHFTLSILRDVSLIKKNEALLVLSQSELKQKYDVLERVGESIGAGLAIVGRDYSIFWANKLLRDIMGETNKKCYQILNRSNSICPNCGVKKVFETNVPLDVHEYEAVNSRGETAWVELRVTPLKDKNGVTSSALELAVPITERKKAEKELLESEAKYRNIFNNSGIGMFRSKLDGSEILDFNEKYLSIFSLTREEMQGKSSLGLWANPQEREQMVRLLKADGFVKDFECNMLNKHGMIRQCLTSVRLYPQQGILEGSILDVTERKANEDKLRESQYLTQKMLDCSPNLIYIYDLQENCNVYANREVLDFLGYTPEQIKLMGSELFANVLHPDDVKVVTAHHARFANVPDNITFDVEYRMKHSSGEWRWLRSRDTLFARTPDGLGKQILGICEDITERKKAEETLSKSEERYRNLADSLPEIVFEADSWGKLTYANQTAFKTTGYSKEDFAKGVWVFDLVEQKEKEKAKAHFKNALSNEPSTGNEYTFVRKDGSTFQTIVISKPITVDNSVVGLRGLVIDISDRKKAEDALKESEKRSRAIVANSPIGIATSGPDKHFLNANEAFCKIMGYTENELLKLTFKDITHIDDLKESATKMRELENGKIPSFMLEKRYIRKDGTVIDGKIMVSAVRNQNGAPNLFVAELEDITERRKAEEHRKVLERKVNDYSEHLKFMVDLRTAQLKDANERLVKSERLAAIGELAGMVGHDLRNPLAGIRNATYFLKKKGKAISEAQAKEMLEIIDNAIGHSDKIINDLLDYSREMHLELTESTLPTLLNKAVQMIQVPDRIQILNHVHEETKIKVDADKIMRIFENLIKNAIDAMPEQGTLEISSCQTEDCIKIVFADTGKGIPEEILPKLFTPLFTTKAQGMGFGLAICKRIIEAHGGTITVKTALNKGTTFTIALPKNPKEPSFENQPVSGHQNAN